MKHRGRWSLAPKTPPPCSSEYPLSLWAVTNSMMACICPKKILVIQATTKTEQYSANWPCLQLCFWPGLCTQVFMCVNGLQKVAQLDPPYGDIPFQRIFIHCWKRITTGAWLCLTTYCFEGTRRDLMSVSPHTSPNQTDHPPTTTTTSDYFYGHVVQHEV